MYLGDPPIIDINNKYVVVHTQDTACVFQRGIPDLIDTEYQEFYQNTYLFCIPALWSDLNRIPETLFVVSTTTA